MGDLTCKSTRLGNLLCARTLVILWLCAAQSIWFVLEQPSSSLMELHCLFQRFIRRVPLRKLTIRMADFGSATAKPTILYSSFLLMKFRVICTYFPCNPIAQTKKQCPFLTTTGKSRNISRIFNCFTKPGNCGYCSGDLPVRSQGYRRPPKLQDSPSTC